MTLVFSFGGGRGSTFHFLKMLISAYNLYVTQSKTVKEKRNKNTNH